MITAQALAQSAVAIAEKLAPTSVKIGDSKVAATDSDTGLLGTELGSVVPAIAVEDNRVTITATGIPLTAGTMREMALDGFVFIDRIVTPDIPSRATATIDVKYVITVIPD